MLRPLWVHSLKLCTYLSTKHARTFFVNLISTHILLCYLSSISRFLRLTPLYVASEEYCNSLATSKGRRRNLTVHYASFSNLFTHTTSNSLSSTSCSLPLSIRSKLTEFTTCIPLSTAHEVYCPVSAGNFCWGTESGWVVKLTIHLCLVQQRLRIRGATPPFSLTYLYCGAWLSKGKAVP